MDFDALAYPHQVTINGEAFKCNRTEDGRILVPYTEEPDVGIGDEVFQKSGKREIQLKVLDVSFLPDGTAQSGTPHRHLLILKVENLTAQPHIASSQASTFHIASISASHVQVGNHNSQSVSISVQNFAEAIAKSNDDEAKSALRKLLENSTVASIAGAGVAGLLALLAKS